MTPGLRPLLRDWITHLLTTKPRVYLAATGAGAGIQKLLWDVPGISSVLVGAEFPYAPEATDRFLGFKPEHYCSEHTAIALAMESYYRAYQPGTPTIGVGLTASVASTTAHRGDHRVFVAAVNDKGAQLYSMLLEPKGCGESYRERDGNYSDALGLQAIFTAAGRGRLDLRSYLPDYEARDCTEEALQVLLLHPYFAASGKHLRTPTNGNGMVLFPGAFNPPHEGHFWMAKEHDAIFHITVNPPHKPGLTVAEVLQRAKLLEGFPRLFTTDDPLYLDKARKFPGAKILIGVDALDRMLDPKWGVEIDPLLRELRQLGIRFLVADREMDGKIQTLDQIAGAPADLCERILRPAQHLPMSSSKIREARATSEVK